jgi:type II secretory pathway component PulF
MRMATVATSCGYRERTKLTPRIYHTTPLVEFCEELACNVTTEEGVEMTFSLSRMRNPKKRSYVRSKRCERKRSMSAGTMMARAVQRARVIFRASLSETYR